MKHLSLAFLLLFASTHAMGIGEKKSFYACASGGSPFVANYDYTNSQSLLAQFGAGWQMYDEVCVINGTGSYVAIHFDWAGTSTNPNQGSPNTTTASPEVPLGPGYTVCQHRFGPNVFMRTLTGATVASGCVYGFAE